MITSKVAYHSALTVINDGDSLGDMDLARSAENSLVGENWALTHFSMESIYNAIRAADAYITS